MYKKQNFLSKQNLYKTKIQKYENMSTLKWFPRCAISTKRYAIRELLLNLSKTNKEAALQIYIEKRKQLLNTEHSNDDYNEIDLVQFENKFPKKNKKPDS